METGFGEWRGVTFLFFKIYVLHFKKKKKNSCLPSALWRVFLLASSHSDDLKMDDCFVCVCVCVCFTF